MKRLMPCLLALVLIFPANKGVRFVGWEAADEAAIRLELATLVDRLGPDMVDGLTIKLVDTQAPTHSCWSDLRCFGDLDYATNPKMSGLIVHEIGHRYFNEQQLSWSDLGYSLGYYEKGRYVHVSGMNPLTGRYERTDRGYIEPNQPYCQHCSYMEPGGQSYKEDFADMFMAWTMGYFSDDEAGRLRQEYMDSFFGVQVKGVGHDRVDRLVQ